MDNSLEKLMMGACEIACRYPSLSLEDAVGDARQLAEMIKQYNIENTQKEESILTAAVGLSVRSLTFPLRRLSIKRCICGIS